LRANGLEMTDRLAEIRSAHNGANPDRVWYSLVSGPDTYWLICEVERLREENERLKYENRALQGDVMDSDHNELVQLREQVSLLRKQAHQAANELQRLRSAIETLRGQMPHWVVNVLAPLPEYPLPEYPLPTGQPPSQPTSTELGRDNCP
jgi:hypothetical protein